MLRELARRAIVFSLFYGQWFRHAGGAPQIVPAWWIAAHRWGEDKRRRPLVLGGRSGLTRNDGLTIPGTRKN